MGRLLWIEANVEESINKLMKQQQGFQVGLVIGQFSTTKDFALHIIRCPDPVDDDVQVEMSDSEEEVMNINNKKQKPIETSLDDDIDPKWVTEHSRQVNRMLGGGMSVIGIYILCDTKMINKLHLKLKSCLVTIHNKLEKNDYIRNIFPHFERYLVHMCLQSGKLTCRTIDLKEEQLTIKPAEHKYQKYIDGWTSISTIVDINIEVPITLKNSNNAIEKKVILACKNELDDIWNSHAVSGFKIIRENESITDSNKKHQKRQKPINEVINISLFKKVSSKANNDKIYVGGKDTADSMIKLVGMLHSKAFVSKKSTFGEAVLYLKADIIRSILTRIELLCEEAQVNNLDKAEEWSLVSPVRVFTPDVSRSLLFSDYVFKDESHDDVIGRFTDLLNIKPKEEDLIYLEHSPDIAEISMILHSDKQSDLHSEIGSELSSSCQEESKDKKLYLAGLAAGFLAMFAALFKFGFDQ